MNEGDKLKCISPLDLLLTNGQKLKINVGDIFDFDFKLTNGVSLKNDTIRFYVEQKNFDFCFEKVEL